MSAVIRSGNPALEIGARSRTEPQPQTKTFLNNCVERIDASDSIADKQQRNATALKIKGYIVIGLSIAAGAATLVLVGLFAPVFVPITLMLLYALKEPILKIFQKQYGNPAARLEMFAEETRAAAQEYHKIQAEDRVSTYWDILELTPLALPPTLDKLKYPLAFYRYWHHLYTINHEAMQKYVDRAKDAQQPDMITSNYIVAAKLRQDALAAKVSAAVFAAIMQKPNFAGDADDICVFKELSPPVDHIHTFADGNLAPAEQTDQIGSGVMDTWAQHAIYREFNDPRADHFVVFKDKHIEPLSIQDVELLPITMIAARILSAIPDS